MKNTEHKMWVEMTEDFTDYYELIIARANLYSKKNNSETKGAAIILFVGAILLLPNFIVNDFLSFIRSIVLFLIAVVLPLFHFALANKKQSITNYINKSDYEGLLNLISKKRYNIIYTKFINTVASLIILYSSYLMWNTPFLLFLNKLACIVTIYSAFCIYSIFATNKESTKKIIEEVLREKEMTTKDLYDEIEAWILTSN